MKALGLIVLAIALFFTFTNPYYQKVKELRASASEYENVLDNLSRIAETRDQLLINYESIPKVEIDRLGKILPANVDTVRFAQELDSISSSHGIAVTDVKVDTTVSYQEGALPALPDEGRPYENVKLSFSFVADYENFRKFLEDLEKSLRIMDVRSVSFQTEENELMQYHVTMETYGLKTHDLAAAQANSDLIDLAAELSEVTFDLSLFATNAYRALVDFSSPPGQDPAGRTNPFAIIGRD
jgi:Tfp pilus assembly protein PilO